MKYGEMIFWQTLMTFGITKQISQRNNKIHMKILTRKEIYLDALRSNSLSKRVKQSFVVSLTSPIQVKVSSSIQFGD